MSKVSRKLLGELGVGKCDCGGHITKKGGVLIESAVVSFDHPIVGRVIGIGECLCCLKLRTYVLYVGPEYWDAYAAEGAVVMTRPVIAPISDEVKKLLASM